MVLLAVVILAALAFGLSACLGVLVGGAVGLANFYGLARIVSAIQTSRRHRAGWLGVLLATKFVALAMVIWVAVVYMGLSVPAFLVGVSICVVAIFFAAITHRRGDIEAT